MDGVGPFCWELGEGWRFRRLDSGEMVPYEKVGLDCCVKVVSSSFGVDICIGWV